MREAPRAVFRGKHVNDLVLAVLLALLIIIIGVGLGWENNKIVPVNSAASAHYNLEPNNRLSFMSEWDGPNYLNIATNGYTSKNEANFFPLYPLAIRAVHSLIKSWLDSALAVSWLCFMGTIYFYLKIIKHLYKLKDSLEALRGALFFILFPTGVFLIATYTEALFALLALGAIYYALQKKYILASLFALLSTATHVTGVFVVLLIAMLLWENRVKPLKILASMVIGSLGIVSYMIYQAHKFGNALAFISAQKKHNWLSFTPAHFASVFLNLNGIFILLLLISIVYWWSRRKSFSVYSALFACIIFVAGKDLGGIGRYTLMAFPLQIMLYDYFRDKKVGYPLVLALSAILWTFFTLRYAGGYTGG